MKDADAKELTVNSVGQVRRRGKDGRRRRGPGGRVLALVEKRADGWALLTQMKELREGGFKTRKAALAALPRHLRREERRRQRAFEERQRELKARQAATVEEMKDPRCAERYVERILAAVPEGWEAEFRAGVYLYGRESYAMKDDAKEPGCGTVVLKSEREELHWRLHRSDPKDTWSNDRGALHVDGSTYFIGDQGGWRCFDRRGVDDSFYTGSLTDPAEVVAEELTRIKEARERGAKMVSIPGFGWRVHRDKVEPLRQKIQNGGSHSFYPSGFGTGYRISARRPEGRYGVEQLSAKTAAFFGVPALWAESFDWD